MTDTILGSIPSPMHIRDELETMLLNDLLGPVGGPEEEIDEQSVRDRYLVGMLAPKRQELSPEEFDELPEGGSGTVEEGSTEYSAPTTKTMFPSSFGLTFCVDPSATALRITARWGSYTRESSETLSTPTGNQKLVWKRTQREGMSTPIALHDGKMTPWIPDPEMPDVEVQGIMRKRPDFWTVTLFLVNGQNEPKTSRDIAWLFQPELLVESQDGQPIFHSRLAPREAGKSDPVTFAEEQDMAMLYRHHVEFAVGHGVSVHAECPDGITDRAFRLQTMVVPSYEVPKATSPSETDIPALAGLVRDMKDLGETPTAELDAKLRPLLVAYDAWMTEREADLYTPDMAPYLAAGQAALARCRQTLTRIDAGLTLLQQDVQAADAFRFANLAMWQQRIHTLYAQKRRRDTTVDFATCDIPANRSWYPFQLAVIQQFPLSLQA
jgi:hypothetical protein